MDDPGGNPNPIKAAPGQMQEEQDPQRRQYRQAIAKFMREQGLESPQRIMYELNGARILRALVEPKRRQIALLIEGFDRRVFFFVGEDAVRFHGQEIANPLCNHAVGGIERGQERGRGIRRRRLIGYARRNGRCRRNISGRGGGGRSARRIG